MTSTGPSMNQLAQSTSPAHATQKSPSTFSTSSGVSTGPNYNVNTTNLMGTPPTSRAAAPGMGMGHMNVGVGMAPGMGMQPGMAPGMGMQPAMGMGMNYSGMGMGYGGMGPRPMYGGAGFGGQPQMGYSGGGMMGGPGMMNPMGMQPQQRQF